MAIVGRTGIKYLIRPQLLCAEIIGMIDVAENQRNNIWKDWSFIFFRDIIIPSRNKIKEKVLFEIAMHVNRYTREGLDSLLDSNVRSLKKSPSETNI